MGREQGNREVRIGARIYFGMRGKRKWSMKAGNHRWTQMSTDTGGEVHGGRKLSVARGKV